MEHSTEKEEAMQERERTVARQLSLFFFSLFLCCVVSDQSAALMRAITDTALSALSAACEREREGGKVPSSSSSSLSFFLLLRLCSLFRCVSVCVCAFLFLKLFQDKNSKAMPQGASVHHEKSMKHRQLNSCYSPSPPSPLPISLSLSLLGRRPLLSFNKRTQSH